jgi:hypothetical protein
MTLVRFGVLVSEAKNSNNGLAKLIRLLNRIFKGMVPFGPLRGLHPVNDVAALSNRLRIQSLNSFQLNQPHSLLCSEMISGNYNSQ